MPVPPQSGRSASTPPRGLGEAARRGGPPDVPAWQRWGVVALLLLVLHISQLLHFNMPGAGSPGWYPSAGLGLVLIAWYGWRGALLVWADVVLAAILRLAFDWHAEEAAECWRRFGAVLLEGVLQVAALSVGWHLYYRTLRGSRLLADPRSMVLFLLLLPGLPLALAAGGRAVAYLPLLETPREGAEEVLQWWAGQALGVVALAPPLLCGVTPWLVRRGLLSAREGAADGRGATAYGPPPLDVAAWIEVGILSACTGTLTLLLIGWHKEATPAGWHVWGVPLLLVVWAGLRQGLRAATLAIAVATVLPLELLGDKVHPIDFQGNLLAHCAALLVAASVSWMRFSEARYRQVAAEIPVVLYTARLEPGRGAPAAEVIFVSPPSADILGAAPAELVGDFGRWLDRVHPRDREILLAAVTQLHRDSRPVTCEYRLDDPDARARVRWLRETLVPHLDHEGLLEGWQGMVLDISEQRALADDLRRTTTMFHTLIGNLPAGVFFMQAPHGQPILVNARARQLLGQRENPSVELKHFSEFYRLYRPDGTPYPVDDLPVVVALRHGASSMREDVVVHRVDGRRVPLVTWGAPISTGTGKGADAAVWVLEDLTALRQAEAARRESEVRLRGVIDALAEGVLVQDPEGVLLDCNAAAGRILGRPLEALVGQTLPADLQRFARADGEPLAEHPSRNVLKTRRPVRDLVLGYERPDGARRWVLMNALPLFLVPETPAAGVVVSLVDLTELVRAQERVRVSEEQYRGLVESLPLLVIQLDADLKVVAGNPAARELTGLGEEELRRRRVEEVFVPQEGGLYEQARAGKPARGECRFRGHDGVERVGYLFLQPQPAGATLLVVDLTRERRLERELERAQRLELVGRLSSGIAHDFNNLLTAILGLTQLVQETLGPDHEAAELVGRILEVGEQASNLAQQLLDYSKQRKIPLRAVPATRVIRRTLEVLRALTPANIRLDYAVPADDVILNADEMQLQQVLMNLCLNARDAMKDGGRLDVRAERCGAEVGPPGNGEAPAGWLRVSVHDSGEGMSEAVRARIFDPFFTTKELGAGLGLAVVKQIVDSFGGEVRVDSEPGLGSRFEVWLPLRPESIAGG